MSVTLPIIPYVEKRVLYLFRTNDLEVMPMDMFYKSSVPTRKLILDMISNMSTQTF